MSKKKSLRGYIKKEEINVGSVSLPVDVAAMLKENAENAGWPVSQLVESIIIGCYADRRLEWQDKYLRSEHIEGGWSKGHNR